MRGVKPDVLRFCQIWQGLKEVKRVKIKKNGP
jgi:hypothetical protein